MNGLNVESEDDVGGERNHELPSQARREKQQKTMRMEKVCTLNSLILISKDFGRLQLICVSAFPQSNDNKLNPKEGIKTTTNNFSNSSS